MYDVAIVGCGPVGALAGNLFGKAGLKTVVLEREADPYPLPRAVHLDHEMMRLFQSAGVVDRVINDMRAAEGHLHVGADNGVIRYMGTVGRRRPFGWSNDYFFYQPELEEHLRETMMRFPNVDLRLATGFLALEQHPDRVALRVASKGRESTIESRWVVACDGARSSVRRQLGIRLDDLEFDEQWFVVDAEVEGTVQFPPIDGVPAEANLQQLSVMMCDPDRPVTVVPGRGNHRRWELMLLPGEDEETMTHPERLTALIGPWLQGSPHRIVRASTYHFHGLIAERWQAGNVFLAGDAAHQTPPFFGQGMCHGMRDVANLAWKMDMVARGTAAPEVLDTYQTERDPHVRAVIAEAIETGRYICVLDRKKASLRDEEMRANARVRNAQQTAADLIPAIANGIVAAGSPGAGERFVQPRLTVDGESVLLDDHVGGGWRLFVADAGAAREAQQAVQADAAGIGLGVVDAGSLDDKGAIRAWLADRGVRAVLVRPDFYVYGTAEDTVAQLVSSLADALAPRGDSKEEVA